jgi:hypothetical protein
VSFDPNLPRPPDGPASAPTLRRGLSRRAVLLGGGVGLLAGAAAGVGIRLSGYDVPASTTAQLTNLAPWQGLVLSAFATRVLPVGAPFDLAFVDRYLATLHPQDERDIGVLVGYLEHLAPVGGGHIRRFTNLGPNEQDQVLQGIEASRIDLLRAGFQGLRAMVFMSYYRTPGAWRLIGYDGPVTARAVGEAP